MIYEEQNIAGRLGEISAAVKGINRRLDILNSKTVTHGRFIGTINEWISAHDAVKDALHEIETYKRDCRHEKTKNNIAIWGLLIMVALNIVLHFTA